MAPSVRKASLRPHRTPRAQLLSAKATAPAGGTGFTFTQDVDNSGNFTLDDQGIRTFSNVRPGTYTVTEIDPSGLGYELVAISCSVGAATVDVATRTAMITCWFR